MGGTLLALSTAARHSIKEPAQAEGHWTVVGCQAICKRTNIHTDEPDQRARIIPPAQPEGRQPPKVKG